MTDHRPHITDYEEAITALAETLGCEPHITAVLAAARVAVGGWHPIETAPRDGTRLLCYAPATEGRAAVVRNDYWWVRERGFALMRPTQPYTRWRPLPQPPALD